MPIARNISEVRDALVAGVDARWAEPLKVYPLRGDEMPDETREVREISAPLRAGAGKGMSAGQGSSWRSRIVAGTAEVHIDRAVYPDLVVRTGDKVRAISRPGKPWWSVLAVDDRGPARLVLQLGEA
ncbi:hypothetical protein L0F51_03920 [Afifella sp. H1R]|uniref:hypothetical protein n=1 Tax=Afifella sp. H1R TaxID=2908841 RepID=UPI001F186B7E|nr:hypothetical protein [Afifella sp. H1R]MCF1502913.1 hypothetical protein [Afifella sp. H1R]